MLTVAHIWPWHFLKIGTQVALHQQVARKHAARTEDETEASGSSVHLTGDDVAPKSMALSKSWGPHLGSPFCEDHNVWVHVGASCLWQPPSRSKPDSGFEVGPLGVGSEQRG